MSSKKKPSKIEVRDTAQNEVVKAKVASVTAASALQNLGTAQASVGRTLATVGEQVQSQLQVLEDVKKVVALTQQDLESLHGKDQVLRSIDELEAQRDELAVKIEVDYTAAAQKHADQQADYQRQLAESSAQFDFELKQSQLAAKAALEQEIHAAKVLERNRREQVEKDFQVRGDALKLRETELAQLKVQVDAFPAQLKADVASASAAAGASVKREYEHQLDNARRDLATVNQLSDLRVETLTQQNAQLQAQLATANDRVEAANAKVAEIAQKALDSASGQRTLTEMQNFVGKDNGTNGAGRKA